MTLKDLLQASVNRRPNAVALKYKARGQWLDVSYNQLLARVRQVAELLSDLKVKQGDRVAILRDNAPDWPEMYFGIVGLGAVAVPLDAKLKEQEVAHILRDSGAMVLMTSVRSYPLVQTLEDRLPALRHVVLADGRDVLPVRSRIFTYHDYDEALQSVADRAGTDPRAYDRVSPKEEDLASLIYTSGTMGRQKGAMLTHGNFVANVHGCRTAADMVPGDNFLLILPLHHAFAFMANLLCPIAVGAQISFVENLKTISENVRDVSPTILIGVPLLLEKMHARIQAGLKANRLGHVLFKLGLQKPIARGIRERLGGRLRMIITGGAACPLEVLNGFGKLGIPVLEGYGLTETAPVLTINPPDAPRPGSVGKALPNVELKLVDPNAEGVGEVAARGPNVMAGYYHAPEATSAIMQDDWLLTGDLGHFDPDGYLTLTGRKKSVIVNREGKNIYPEEVEQAVCVSPFIQEALALGYGRPDETRGERVGIIVVPNDEAILTHATEQKSEMTDGDIRTLIRDEVKRTSMELSEYKRPRRIRIRSEEFLKTSTGKIKRYLYSLDEVEVE